MEQNVDPQTPPGEGQGEGQGASNPTPGSAPAATPWYQELGFNDEAQAIDMARHAKQKISELGMENSRLRQTPNVPAVSPGQGQPDQSGLNITFDEFVAQPGKILALVSERSAQKVLSAVQAEQQVERIKDQVAKKEGIERWELDEVLQDLVQGGTERAYSVIAGVAKMRKQGYSAAEIRTAVEQSNQNKARTAQAPSGAHVPASSPGTMTQEQVEGMSYPEIQKALAEGKIVF